MVDKGASGLQVLQNDQDLDKTSYQSWYDAKRKVTHAIK